jgi:hypothetical protein
MKAEGRWKGSGARLTSRQVVGLILQQQGEDEPDQLTGGQDEGAAVFETHGFAILTLVEGVIVGGFEAHAIGPLDQIVTQVAVAGLSQVASFTRELTGVDTRPPETGEPGESGLTLMNEAGLALGGGHETLDILDFGQQPGGIDRATARDRSEMGLTGQGLRQGLNGPIKAAQWAVQKSDMSEQPGQDGVDRLHPLLRQRVSLGRDRLQGMSGAPRVAQGAPADLAQRRGQPVDVAGSEFIRRRISSQRPLAALGEGVAERLASLVGVHCEHQGDLSGLHFLPRQTVDQKETIARQPLQGQGAGIQVQAMRQRTETHPLGDSPRIFGVGLAAFAQGFLEGGDPMGVE